MNVLFFPPIVLPFTLPSSFSLPLPPGVGNVLGARLALALFPTSGQLSTSSGGGGARGATVGFFRKAGFGGGMEAELDAEIDTARSGRTTNGSSVGEMGAVTPFETVELLVTNRALLSSRVTFLVEVSSPGC